MLFDNLINEIIDFRGRTPAKLGMEWGGNIISLSANNVKNGFIDHNAEGNCGSEELYLRWMGKTNIVKGDIIFTMEAPLGNALLLPDSKKYILSQRVVAFKTKSNVLNSFLIQVIWGEGFQNKIDKLATGSTAKGINQKTLKNISIQLPCIKEQQKIADCLSSLDDLITAENKKLDALKTHKKGLMQQLFPAEGETVPRLRFPEFSGDWEERKLGEVARIQSGGTPDRKNADYWGGNIPWVTTSLIDSNTIHNVDEFITEAGLKNSSAKIFPKETILMAMYGQGKTRGKVAVLGISAATNQACAAIIVNGKIEVEFLLQNLMSRYEEIRKISNSGGQENLSAGLIENINIPLPENKLEQQKIADFLSSVDELISAQIKKIDALKTHKKGLMQQLFPVLSH